MNNQFPSHAQQLTRLNRVEGQVRGIRKMVEERRYCVDIMSQVKAVQAALDQVRMGVMETHIHHCVKESLESKDPAYFEEKIAELVRVLGKMS